MYELKEVILKNNNFEKKRLVINFHEESHAILSEFLMSDASLLSEELTLAFNQLSNGSKKRVTLTGNRCAVVIEEETTEISDLFDELDIEGYPTLKISTKQFNEYVSIWHRELIDFNKKNT